MLSQKFLTAATLAALSALANAAGVVKFTITDLGTLGGSFSAAMGLNDQGQVVGSSALAGDAIEHAFSFSAGVLSDRGSGSTASRATAINSSGVAVGQSGQRAVQFSRPLTSFGDFGGDTGAALGLNDAGTAVGWATNALGQPRAFQRSGSGTLVDITAPGVSSAGAFAINASGVVVGRAGDAFTRAVIWRNGQMNWIDTPPQVGIWSSVAVAVNSQGDAVGHSGLLDQHAYVYRDGTWTALSGDEATGGVPPLNRTSRATGINDSGQIVGQATGRLIGSDPFAAPRYQHGFLHAEGARLNLNNHVLGNPTVAVRDAVAINRHGQIAGQGDNEHALLLTPSGFVEWRGPQGGPGASFSDAAHWDSGGLGFAPNKFLTAIIDGSTDTRAVLSGPASALLVSVGGTVSGSGRATLQLDGGTLAGHVVLGSRGELTGDGRIDGDVTNHFVVRAVANQALAVSGALVNHGLVTGGGRLDAALFNATDGSLVVSGNPLLALSGSSHINNGLIRVASGSVLSVTGGELLNNAGATVALEGGVLQLREHLLNAGQLQLSGSAVLRADVQNASGATISVARVGQGRIDGDLVNDGLVTVGSAATLTYEGTVSGTGSFSAGTGARHVFAGRFEPGHSMAALSLSQAEFQGTLEMEIGGLAAGSGHDQIGFTSNVWFDSGAVLEVVLVGGFAPQAGADFTLFTYAREPLATAATLRLPTLAADLAWDASTLYSDGHLRVAAVPEAGTWLLWLQGLLGVLGARGWSGRPARLFNR